jgi:cysteine desulfurase
VLGLARCNTSRGGHVVSNKAEHHAVLNAIEYLEKCEGFEVTWLNISHDGIVDLDQLADSIRPETRLVSIMTANNEVGVVQPLREICRFAGARRAFHSDVVHRLGKRRSKMSLVDAASFAAHKFMGQKAQVCFSCARDCRFNPSWRRRAKASAGRGLKTSRRSPALAAAAWIEQHGHHEKRKLCDDLWNRITAISPGAVKTALLSVG